MSSTPNLDELRLLSVKLTGLLADPQPGVFVWQETLSDTLKAIAAFADHTARDRSIFKLIREVRELGRDAEWMLSKYDPEEKPPCVS